MFTDICIQRDIELSMLLQALIDGCRELAVLKDNDVDIAIFTYVSGELTDVGGWIQLATELEKMEGWDAVIYINDYFRTYMTGLDIEAFIYQLLVTVEPCIVGKDNKRILKIGKTHGITVSPRTVAKYGKDIKWYRQLFTGREDE